MGVSRELEEGGFPEQARALETATKTVCMSGWEWLGELGLGVEAVKSKGALPKNISEKLELILATAKSKKPYG